MLAIEREELAALITEGISAMPQSFQEGIGEQLVRNALSGRLTASTTSVETQLLARAASKYRQLIRDEAIEKLLNCQIISIPAPICNAKAKIRQGIPYIVIFDGLLDMAVATIEMSYAVQGLPIELDNSFPKSDFPDVSTKAWTAVIFSALINRFLTHGEALPNFQLLISSPTIRGNIEHALLGTVWWTLLHELGHIELGHMQLEEGQSRLTISNEMLVNEEISMFQHQEFEADEYVFNCLTDMGKKAFYSWTNSALGPVMMLETLLSKSKDTHPLSINRLDRAYGLSHSLDEIAIEVMSKEHLIRHSKAHVNIKLEHESIRSMGGQPILIHWSRDELFAALHTLSTWFLDAGVDINPFIYSTNSGWRSLFEYGQ